MFDNTIVFSDHRNAGVSCHHLFHPGSHKGRLGLQKRYRLTLHVGTHQRPVGIIMLQKRDQRGGDAHQLVG